MPIAVVWVIAQTGCLRGSDNDAPRKAVSLVATLALMGGVVSSSV